MRSFRLGSAPARRRVLGDHRADLVRILDAWSRLRLIASPPSTEDAAALRLNFPSASCWCLCTGSWRRMVSASLGASLDLKKLLVYPIPRDKLFLVEVLLRVANAAEMLMVLVGGLAGLLRNPLLGGWAAVAAGCGLPGVVHRLQSAALGWACGICWSGCWRESGCARYWCWLLVLTTAVPRVLMMCNVRLRTLERWLRRRRIRCGRGRRRAIWRPGRTHCSRW